MAHFNKISSQRTCILVSGFLVGKIWKFINMRLLSHKKDYIQAYQVLNFWRLIFTTKLYLDKFHI